jgi:protease-4
MTDEAKFEGKDVVYVQTPRKSSGWRTFWITLLVVGTICGFCGVLPFVLLLSSDTSGTITETSTTGEQYTYILGDEESKNNLLAIYIDQPILTSSQDYADDVVTSLLVGQYVFGYEIKDQLMKAADDSSVKGVVLFINSPGGTVIGARAIADGVAYYKERTGKPVYAYIEDIAASGAYWAAASADKIVAEQGSLIGSIGVLMGPFEYYDKLVTLGGVGTENGISINYITGGKYKDLGNPTKKISEEELAVLQKGIDYEYDVFVAYVAKQRKLSHTVIKDEVRALIYGVTDATRYKLIDSVGNREKMLEDLSSVAGVSDDYKVVKVGVHTSLFGGLFASLTKPTGQQVEAPARVCALCGKYLYFSGNPLDY